VDKFPDGIRGESSGKLTDVLDHLLRVGDEKVSENIVKAYKERGLTPPGHLKAPPSILPENYVYWEAFQDLQSERVARGFIPINSIIEYCKAYSFDFDVLKRIIWKVDRVLLLHWKNQDEVEKVQREAQAEQKKSLTMNPGSIK